MNHLFTGRKQLNIVWYPLPIRLNNIFYNMALIYVYYTLTAFARWQMSKSQRGHVFQSLQQLTWLLYICVTSTVSNSITIISWRICENPLTKNTFGIWIPLSSPHDWRVGGEKGAYYSFYRRHSHCPCLCVVSSYRSIHTWITRAFYLTHF